MADAATAPSNGVASSTSAPNKTAPAPAAKALKKMGIDEEQWQEVSKRDRALRKLGLSEDDMTKARKVWVMGVPDEDDSSKERRVTGYTKVQRSRSKGMKVLGTTEEKLEEEIAKELSSLGAYGRKRSCAGIGVNAPVNCYSGGGGI